MRTALIAALAAATVLAASSTQRTEVSAAPAPAAAKEVVVAYEAGATTQTKQAAANLQCQKQYGVTLGVFRADDYAGHATYACTKA